MNERRNKHSIQINGRSVEDAVQKALRELGLTRDEVEIEVIKPGSRGLLGLLGEEAVVRVTARTRPSPPPPLERARVPAERRAPPPPRAADEAPARELNARRGPVTHSAADRLPGESANKAALPAAAPDDLVQQGAAALQTLLDHMGIRGRVTSEVVPEGDAEPPAVLLNITGTDLGVLIGRQGETLRDLQFMTNLIVSRHTQHWPNLIVDVEHYKSRRQKSLEDLAKRTADRVRASGQPVSLEPMPPHERRFVHLALRDDPDVLTESTGQDDKRRVVIMLKK